MVDILIIINDSVYSATNAIARVHSMNGCQAAANPQSQFLPTYCDGRSLAEEQ